MTCTTQSDVQNHRVMVLRECGRELLLCTDGNRFALPSVTIPRRQRIAGNLTAAMRDVWGEDIVCLLTLGTPTSIEGGDRFRYSIGEHLRTCDGLHAARVWRSVTSLAPESFVDTSDYFVLEHFLAQHGVGDLRGKNSPFARLGWFQELMEWVQQSIGPQGLQLNGRFLQLNASSSFGLIRFETNGRAVWFKAVGEPNQRESSITVALSELFPCFLPPLVAVQPAWNGWLSGEVEGTDLAEVMEIGPWMRAATDLGRLQVAAIHQTSRLLRAGTRDLRAGILLAGIGPYFDGMDQLMQQQIKTSPSALSRSDLTRLAEHIEDALARLAELHIPDTLGHLDLNPGNIIVATEGSVFLDWAEAYVGNPFFSFQYLLEYFRRVFGTNLPAESKLAESYASEWADLILPGVIAEGLALAPLLTAYAYAARSDTWRQPERLRDSEAAGYLRSVTRRMQREADKLENRGLLCQR